jgi:glycosyltransferase involved in cell wall biosynthesis
MKIGIAISTHNRRETAEHAIREWRRFMPEGTKLVIVDDASDVPYPGADYRFEQRAGISATKNKGVELLEDYDHIFLVDDDILPLNNMWAGRYIFSNMQHACYIFGRKLLWQGPDYKVYDLPRGCLLYFTRRCIDIAGGFDTNFTGYGYEHVQLSQRIFNRGLTPAPFIDIPNSVGLFYSHDEHKTVQSSIKSYERIKHINVNRAYFEKTKSNNSFIPYK